MVERDKNCSSQNWNALPVWNLSQAVERGGRVYRGGC